MSTDFNWARTEQRVDGPAPYYVVDKRGEVIELPCRFRFTDAAIEALPYCSEGQRLFQDEKEPGLGLVVGKTTKTLDVAYTVKRQKLDASGKVVTSYESYRRKIGRFPTWGVDAARKEPKRRW